MALTPRQKVTVASLVFYWPTMFIMTHIPVPRLPSWVLTTHLSDKVLHFIGYLIFGFLLWFALSPNKRVNWGKVTVWLILAIAVWYGAIDEWLQGFVGRNPDVNDFYADMAGVLAAFFLLTIFDFWPAAVLVMAILIFGVTNLGQLDLYRVKPSFDLVFHLASYSFFTVLWIQYIARKFSLFSPGNRWLAVTVSAPLMFLIGVRLYAMYAGRSFRPVLVAIAAVGIIVVMEIYYVAGLLRDKKAKQLYAVD